LPVNNKLGEQIEDIHMDLDINQNIPDPQNTHIDTLEFESELNELFGSLHGNKLENANLWNDVYENIITKITNPLSEPNENDLVCRYFTPAKFLWFAHQNAIYFSSAQDFEDSHDSDIPEDYKNSVRKVLKERSVIPLLWDDHLERMRSRWLVSCWTSLDNNNHDDYLLWHRYAGNELGVGVVITYGELKKIVESECKKNEEVKTFQSGCVGYEHPLHTPPFNKRNMFRNEKEVRFACKTELLAGLVTDVSSLKKKFSLRFSPDAPSAHIDSVREVWEKMGGGNEYSISGY
jgi:hypothetical protein